MLVKPTMRKTPFKTHSRPSVNHFIGPSTGRQELTIAAVSAQRGIIKSLDFMTHSQTVNQDAVEPVQSSSCATLENHIPHDFLHPVEMSNSECDPPFEPKTFLPKSTFEYAWILCFALSAPKPQVATTPCF
jgi:hypothetical protein